MEPGLRALLHANQPGLLPPSARPPAAIPPSRPPHGKARGPPQPHHARAVRIDCNPARPPGGTQLPLARPSSDRPACGAVPWGFLTRQCPLPSQPRDRPDPLVPGSVAGREKRRPGGRSARPRSVTRAPASAAPDQGDPCCLCVSLAGSGRSAACPGSP